MAVVIENTLKTWDAFIEKGQVRIAMPSADVLTLNSTPIQAIAARGTNKMIVVKNCFAGFAIYGSTPYATNTGLALKFSGADLDYFNRDSILAASVAKFWSLSPKKFGGAAGNTEMILNTDLNIYVPTGNPTSGDSNLIVLIDYEVMTIN